MKEMVKEREKGRGRAWEIWLRQQPKVAYEEKGAPGVIMVRHFGSMHVLMVQWSHPNVWRMKNPSSIHCFPFSLSLFFSDYLSQFLSIIPFKKCPHMHPQFVALEKDAISPLLHHCRLSLLVNVYHIYIYIWWRAARQMVVNIIYIYMMESSMSNG